VTWAIEFINNVIEEVFSPLIDMIREQWMQYCQHVQSMAHLVVEELETSGSIDPRTANKLADAIHGEFYSALSIVAVLAKVVSTSVQVITLGASNLVGYMMMGIVGVIAYNALGIQSTAQWDQGTPMYGVAPWQAWTYNVASNGGTEQVPDETAWALGAAAVGVFTSILGVADLLYVSTTKILSGIILADGIIALALGLYSVIANDAAMGIIGFFISIESLIISLAGAVVDPYMGGISLIFGGIGAWMSYEGCDWD
jgi:hypothetical protein